MSHWDFGRPADGQQDTPRRSGAAYTPDLPDLPDLPGGAEDDAWPAQGDWPADGEWTPRDEWPAYEGRSPGGQWPPGADSPPAEAGRPEEGPPEEGWPADDGWDDDDGTAPYPLTYERDDFVLAGPQPAAPPRERWEPRPPAAGPGDGDQGGPAAGDRQWRPRAERWSEAAGGGRREGHPAPPAWPGQDPGLPEEDPAEWAAEGTGRGRRRLLLPAGVAVAGAAVGAAAVLLSGGHPGAAGSRGAGGAGGAAAPAAPPSSAPAAARSAPASTAPSPPPAGPLTMTEAKGALAGYTTVNNGANAQRSDTQLASVESGSSYAIDAALYQQQRAAGTAPYPAFGPVSATYYLPRDEPAGGPRWFVVQVANAFNANPAKVTSSEYLLFTQSAPGGAWQDALEPYLLSGASAPRVALGADGMATAVSADAPSVAVAPGQLPAATAASLDGAGAGAGTGTGTGTAAIADPGNLADHGDQKTWQGKMAGGTVTDAHTAAAGPDGQEFALLTADGGALVFYTDAAEVTITPPAGSALHLDLPGFYSPGQALSRAGVGYLEQFAAYDPPAGGGGPRVVADYSGVTAKG
jgi:hypothetical protein